MAERPLPDGIVRGRSLRGNHHLTADVVVVGSGAGGSVAAAILAESGRDVVILEEGAWVDSVDFAGDEQRLTALLFAEQGLRCTADLSMTLLQGGAAGGGTTVNWMIMLRTPDHVFDEWERRFGLADLSPTAMAPHFAAVEAELRSGPVPEGAHSPSNRVLLDGAAKLGWRASPATINARGCLRAGACSLGCAWDAKQDARLTWLPRALARGARLHTHVEVQRLSVLDRSASARALPRKRVEATVWDAGEGTVTGVPGSNARRPLANLTVDAPIVILAAGAVGTPVILQRSGMGGGAVGRFLRLHPTTCIMGRYDRDMYPLAGIPLSAMCDEFVTSGRNGYGFWIECPALTPGLVASAMSGIGAEHRDAMAGLWKTAPLIALTRDGADLDISNGDVQLASRGRVRMNYRLGPSDADTVRDSLVAAARLHLASGAREVSSLHTPAIRVRTERDLALLHDAPLTPNRLTLFSAHVNGTCRMGTNRAMSGTSPDGERWGVPGLYVCDGSLLPTALGVNPQETIMALSRRIAMQVATR